MATKLAAANSPHTAGIFADMTVDGPEIGTLVLVVDRALDEVLGLADRVVVLVKGQVAFAGEPAGLRTDEAFMHSVLGV